MPQPSLHLLGFLFSIILSRGKCCCGRSLRTPLWLALPPAFCLKRPGPLTPPCCPGTCSSFPATSNPAPQGSPGGDVFSPASPGTCFPRLCRQTPEVQGSGFLGVRSARLTGPTQATLAIRSWGSGQNFHVLPHSVRSFPVPTLVLQAQGGPLVTFPPTFASPVHRSTSLYFFPVYIGAGTP